jgi:hypothetical protein
MEKYSADRSEIKQRRMRILSVIHDTKDLDVLEGKYRIFDNVLYQLRKQNPGKTISDTDVFAEIIRMKNDPKRIISPGITSALEDYFSSYPPEQRENIKKKFIDFKYRYNKKHPGNNLSNEEILKLLIESRELAEQSSQNLKTREEEERQTVITNRENRLRNKQLLADKLTEIYGPLSDIELKRKMDYYRQIKVRLKAAGNQNPTEQDILNELRRLNSGEDYRKPIADVKSKVILARIYDLLGYYKDSDKIL